jgi:molybdopterin-guanine dinucleotide biosynthesis protein
MTDAVMPQVRLPWQPCERCGTLGVDACPDGSIVLLACPSCGHEEERRRLPFFSVTGPSGSGKSTLVRRLWRELPECVTLDGDLLWNPKIWKEREAFYTLWLSLAAQISQSGRPVVLCTAAMPDDWHNATPRVLVANVHMLALVCDETELLSRLATRVRPLDVEGPADFLEQTLTFNRWLSEHVEHIDTSTHDPDETAGRVTAWVRSHL